MKHLLFTTVCLFILLLPLAGVEAAIKYIPMTEVPILKGAGGVNAQALSTGDYIKALYALSISVAGLLAVIKIIYGGVQYMLSDIVTRKEQAIKDIRGALFGLVIVITAVFLLNVINPQLTLLNIFEDLESVQQGSVKQPAVKSLAQPDSKNTVTVSAQDNTQQDVQTSLAAQKQKCIDNGGIWRTDPLPSGNVNYTCENN